MDNRHLDKIPKEATTCLADYCDIFQCPEEFRGKRPCISSEIEKSKSFCQAILEKCLPSSGSEISQVIRGETHLLFEYSLLIEKRLNGEAVEL